MSKNGTSDCHQDCFYTEAVISGVRIEPGKKFFVKIEGTEKYCIKRDKNVYNLLWFDEKEKDARGEHEFSGIMKSADHRYSLDFAHDVDPQLLLSQLQPSRKVKIWFQRTSEPNSWAAPMITKIEVCSNNA